MATFSTTDDLLGINVRVLVVRGGRLANVETECLAQGHDGPGLVFGFAVPEVDGVAQGFERVQMRAAFLALQPSFGLGRGGQ